MVVTTPSPKIRMLWVPHRHFEPAHTHTHTHTHTHSRTHTHTHIHTHTLSYTYACTFRRSLHAGTVHTYMYMYFLPCCPCSIPPPTFHPHSEHLNLHYNDTIIMVNTETIFTRKGGGHVAAYLNSKT